MTVLKSNYKYRIPYKKSLAKRVLTKKQKWIYYPPPPPEFFANKRVSASPCQKCTSLYTFGSEFRQCRNIAFDKTSGIRAAFDKCSTYHRYASALFSPNSLYLSRLFPKKITDRMSVGLSNSKFVQQIDITNLQFKNIQGCIFLNVPPVNFFLCLVLASPISKKNYYKKQTAQYMNTNCGSALIYKPTYPLKRLRRNVQVCTPFEAFSLTFENSRAARKRYRTYLFQRGL